MTFEELQAKLVAMQEMYDNLLTKYRSEIEKRCAVESGYQTLYRLCVKDGIIPQPTKQEDKPVDTSASENNSDNK